MADTTIVVRRALAALDLTERERRYSTRGKGFRRAARIPVRTITMSQQGKVIGFLAPRRMGRTGIPTGAARSKLTKMFVKNTGQKFEDCPEENLKSSRSRTATPLQHRPHYAAVGAK